MIRDLPVEAVDAYPFGQPDGPGHLAPPVIPVEDNVPPVDERDLAPRLVAQPDEGLHDVDDLGEISAAPVLLVGRLVRAVDGERDFVEPGSDDPFHLGFVEKQAVRADVEVDARVAGLEVFDHLDRLRVNERVAVVEEIEPDETRTDLVHDAAELVEREERPLPGGDEAGFLRTHGLEAGQVAANRGLEEDPGQDFEVDGTLRDRRALGQGPLEAAIEAERRVAFIEAAPDLFHFIGAPDVEERGFREGAERSLAARIGAAADNLPVAEDDEDVEDPVAGEARFQAVGLSGVL